MDDRCYFAKKPPKLELRGGHVFLVPAGSHCEVVFTPQTLQKFVATCNQVLDEWHESRGTVVPIRAPR